MPPNTPSSSRKRTLYQNLASMTPTMVEDAHELITIEKALFFASLWATARALPTPLPPLAVRQWSAHSGSMIQCRTCTHPDCPTCPYLDDDE